MRTIDIQDQAKLGLRRLFNITVNGIRYRLFRSLVTVMVITVAIAFLMSIVTESLIKQSLAKDTGERLWDIRQAARWATHISSPPSTEGLMRELAEISVEEPLAQEIMYMGSLTEADLMQLKEKAQQGAAYLDFFQSLDYASARRMAGGHQSPTTFNYLADTENFENFNSLLAEMRNRDFPDEMETFSAYLESWPETLKRLNSIREGYAKASRSVANSLEGQTIMERLTDVEGNFGNVLEEAGFLIDEPSKKTIAHQAQLATVSRQAEIALSNPRVSQQLAAKRNVVPQDVTSVLFWETLRKPANGVFFYEIINEEGLAGKAMTAAMLTEIARLRTEEASLAKTSGIRAEAIGGILGMGERMSWLISLSLVVCAVGIANAMLMSVTERYREIATLKCLGALDGSIMTIFVIEAGLLGSVGGLIGAILGGVLGILRMVLPYGMIAANSIPWLFILFCILVSIVIGILIAAVAAIYPSFKAARLAPMEAMRIE